MSIILISSCTTYISYSTCKGFAEEQIFKSNFDEIVNLTYVYTGLLIYYWVILTCYKSCVDLSLLYIPRTRKRWAGPGYRSTPSPWCSSSCSCTTTSLTLFTCPPPPSLSAVWPPPYFHTILWTMMSPHLLRSLK